MTSVVTVVKTQSYKWINSAISTILLGRMRFEKKLIYGLSNVFSTWFFNQCTVKTSLHIYLVKLRA